MAEVGGGDGVRREIPPDTARLAFREMTLDDLDFVASMLGHPEVMRHYPRRYTRDESADWIGRQQGRYLRDGHGLWLVILRDTGEPVGQVGLVRQLVEGSDELEVAYLLHRNFWKRGLATEAAATCRDFGFAERDSRRLISLIRPVNRASQRVARRIGMRPERRVKFANLEHIVFSISRQDGR